MDIYRRVEFFKLLEKFGYTVGGQSSISETESALGESFQTFMSSSTFTVQGKHGETHKKNELAMNAAISRGHATQQEVDLYNKMLNEDETYIIKAKSFSYIMNVLECPLTEVPLYMEFNRQGDYGDSSRELGVSIAKKRLDNGY